MNIWKVSHGSTSNFTDSDSDFMLKNKLIAINHEKGTSQYNYFTQEMNVGDIFYLYRKPKIVLIGKITSINKEYNSISNFPESLKGSTFHSYELIENASKILPNLVSLGQDKWLPSGNSTVFPVPTDKYGAFNEKILKNFFTKEIKDLIPSYHEDTKPQEISKCEEMRTLNTILFGPPGTGKTYNTINQALSILMGSVPNDRTEAKKVFDAYVTKGQIVFTTFHQSYGYEEFIEGIKPDMESDDEEVRYEVKDGVFKKLSITALYDAIKILSNQIVIGFEELYDALLDVIQGSLPFELSSLTGSVLQVRSASKKGNLYLYHKDSDVKHTVGKERLKVLYERIA